MSDGEKIFPAVNGLPSSCSAVVAAAQFASAMHWFLHAIYVVDITEAVNMYSNIDQELSEPGDVLPERGQRINLLEEQGNLALVETRGICDSLNVQITTERVAGTISAVVLESAPRFGLLALGRQGNRYHDGSQHLGSNFWEIGHSVETSLLIGGREYSPHTMANSNFMQAQGEECS